MIERRQIDIAYYLLILCLLFLSGSVLGWCIEVIFRRFSTDNKERIWINPGFLMGPCLPLYGFALVALFLLTCAEKYIRISNDILRIAVLFALMTTAITIVEFAAGEIFILRRHLKLWDYSDMRFNYKGIICLRYTFYWTVLAAFYYFVIHPRIERLIALFTEHPYSSFLIGLFYGILLIDVCYSFELTAKIKAFAVENRMIIRYEELKKHISVTARNQKQRFSFFTLPHSIKELLTGYMEKQKEQAKNGRLNDFIDDKIMSRFKKKNDP